MMTGELTTIARPYAKAAFEAAVSKNALDNWGVMLEAAAFVASQKEVGALLASPKVSSVQLSSLFKDALDKVLDDEKRNFIDLLAENHRLPILPEIKKLFALQKANYEKTIMVDVETAFELSDKQQKSFVDALTKRLNRKVKLKCSNSPEILGGAIVKAGDLVIDGSVKGKLNRLLESL